MKQQVSFDAKRKARYVIAFEKCGEVAAAAAAVNISRRTVYNHMQSDPDFADEVEKADGRLLGRIIGEVEQLALFGVETKHYAPDGKTVTHSTRKKSEKLLLAWLKRREPANWSDKIQVDQTVTNRAEPIAAKDIPRDARNSLRDALAKMPGDIDPSAN